MKGEVEGGAAFNFAFRPDAAALAGQDALDGCEADAGSGEVAFAVQALEGVEELLHIILIEAGAIVADRVDGLAGGRRRLCTELDAGVGVVRGVLPGIAEQVVEDDAHEAGVGVGFRGIGDYKFDLAIWVAASMIQP